MKGSKNKTIKKKLKLYIFSYAIAHSQTQKQKFLLQHLQISLWRLCRSTSFFNLSIFPPKSINKKLNKTLSMMKLSLFVNFSATIHTDLLKSYYLKNFLHLLLKNFPNKRYVQQRPINFKNHKKKRSLFKNPNYSCKNQPKII